MDAPDPGPVARTKVILAEERTLEIVAQRVCEGETLRGIASSLGLSYRKLIAGLRENAPWFADAIAWETLPIAARDEPTAALRVKAHQWLVSKLDRRWSDNQVQGYGAPIQINIGVRVDSPVREIVDNSLTDEI